MEEAEVEKLLIDIHASSCRIPYIEKAIEINSAKIDKMQEDNFKRDVQTTTLKCDINAIGDKCRQIQEDKSVSQTRLLKLVFGGGGLVAVAPWAIKYVSSILHANK